MKKIFAILITVLISISAFAQYGTAPQAMSYHAVIRNSSDALVKNSPIGIKISILQGSSTGPAVYVETHTLQTNQNGLLVLQIGTGTVVSGIFSNGIYWGQTYFLKTELDILGGTNYTMTSTTELLSVPVSNYAHVSGSLHGASWNFIGAYKQFNQATTDFLIEGYSFINYLGVDKISWTWKHPSVDNNLDGNLDVGEIGFEHTLYGTVLGNVITFPPQDVQGDLFPQMIGTLIGNNLTITYGSPLGKVLGLLKQ